MIIGFFADHDESRDVLHRLRHILVGDDTAPEARVRTAMLIAAISGAVMHPFVVDLDDELVRAASASRPAFSFPACLSLASRPTGLPPVT